MDPDVEVAAENTGVNMLDLSEGVQKSGGEKKDKNTLSDATRLPYPVPLPHPPNKERKENHNCKVFKQRWLKARKRT